MLRPNSQLNMAAFTLYSEFAQTGINVWGLFFPPSWRPHLDQLERERSEREDVTFRIASLNATIIALCSQLMTVPGQARPEQPDRPAQPWLLSRQCIPVDRIVDIVQAWCYTHYDGLPSLNDAIDTIQADDLEWQKVNLALHVPAAENGTADPDGLAYTLLPAYLADLLIQRNTTLSVYKREYPLVRVPLPSTSGAQVMTWPPAFYLDEKNQRWGFSYVITISVQTLVGNPEPRIHTHYSVRRWVSKSLREGDKLYLSGRSRSAYLMTTESWMGLSPGPMFTQARMRGIHDDGRRKAIWDDSLAEIAHRLGISGWPDAETLIQQPELYLQEQGRQGLSVGIIEYTPRYHPIKPGLDLSEHAAVTVRLGQVFKDELQQMPGISSLPAWRKGAKHPLDKALLEIPAEERLSALAESIGKNITIEIWWTTPNVRDRQAHWIEMVLRGDNSWLIDIESKPSPVRRDEKREEVETLNYLTLLDGLLDNDDEMNIGHDSTPDEEIPSPLLPSDDSEKSKRKRPTPKTLPDSPVLNNERLVQLPQGGRLRLIPRQLGELGAPFPASVPPPQSKSARAQYQRQQTESRVQASKDALDPTDEPTLAIIELPNYNDPQAPRRRAEFAVRDPKRALRRGMALTGRITKFIAPEPEQDLSDLDMRCKNTGLAGLRQMGYLPAALELQPPAGEILPERMLLVGVWVLRLTRKRSFTKVHLPVVVLFPTDQRQIFAWLPDGKGVRSFREAMLNMTTLTLEQVSRGRQREVVAALRQFLTHDVFRQGYDDVVVLLEAQNSRMTLTGLTNAAIHKNVLRLERSESGTPVDKLQGRLRIIRLRSNLNNETPEWYTPEAEGDRGFKQGIWPVEGGMPTYYNIAGKPHTMSGKKDSKQVDPGAHYAIPSILEILPFALQPGDKSETWAYLVDQWRRMAYTTQDMTRLPLPIRWCKEMDDYATVIGPWLDASQWGEADDDGDDESKPTQLSLFDSMDD